MHHLTGLALAAFDMRRRPARIGGEYALAFPTGTGVVDSAVHAFGEIAHRIGHAHRHPLLIHEREQRIGIVAGGNGNVLAEAKRVELIDPVIIWRFGAAALHRHALKLRAWDRVQLPALRAGFARRRNRSIQRTLAELTVKARHLAAGERGPDDTFAVDIHAARTEAGVRILRVIPWHLVVFRQHRLGIVTDDATREAEVRGPNCAVGRAWRCAVEADLDMLVLGGIGRVVGADISVDLTVLVYVDDERRPTLARCFVVRRIPLLGVEPADNFVVRVAARRSEE